MFETRSLPDNPEVTAPDGSSVRILLQLSGGSLAHFELAPRRTSRAVSHRTVAEIWYFLSGRGDFWRKLGKQESIVRLEPGLCLTIPLGTHFQFRSLGNEPLRAVAITMPPWPGPEEAFFVQGKWPPSE